MADVKQGTPPALHELEAVVMDEMWRLGSANVRTVMEKVNERGPKDRAYTTYMTILARLDRKGLLSRRREGKTDLYTPRMSREEYLEARAALEVDALVEEFGDKALVHFARQMSQLDPTRQQRLRRLARGA
jgi:predicted transcriptional regulator